MLSLTQVDSVPARSTQVPLVHMPSRGLEELGLGTSRVVCYGPSPPADR